MFLYSCLLSLSLLQSGEERTKTQLQPFLAYTQQSIPKDPMIWDSSIAFPNQCISTDGNEVWIYDPFSPAPNIIKLQHPVPEQYRARNMAKYRNGKFYARSGKEIFEWDFTLKRWFSVLRVSSPFMQFEVSPDGSIIVIGTLNEKAQSSKSFSQAELSPDLLSDGRLIEIYEPKSEKPKKSIDYSDELIELSKMIGQARGFDRTFAYNEYNLLISTDLGIILLYNSTANTIKKLDTPWKAITPVTLKSIKVDPTLPKNVQTLVDADGLPGYTLYIYPVSPHRAYLFYRDTSLNEVLSERMHKAARKRGMNFGLLNQLNDEISINWKLAELDFVESRFVNIFDINEKDVPETPWVLSEQKIIPWSSQRKWIEDLYKKSKDPFARTKVEPSKSNKESDMTKKSETRVDATKTN